MTQHNHTIVIDAGQESPLLAARIIREGMKIAMTERKRFAGIISTKTLVAVLGQFLWPDELATLAS